MKITYWLSHFSCILFIYMFGYIAAENAKVKLALCAKVVPASTNDSLLCYARGIENQIYWPIYGSILGYLMFLLARWIAKKIPFFKEKQN